MEELGELKQVKITTEYSRDQSSSSNKINVKTILIILGIAILISLIIIAINKKIQNDKLNHYDYIIVGAGLYGATFNYLAKKRGKRTLVIERRNVTGGNLYCQKKEVMIMKKINIQKIIMKIKLILKMIL